MPDFPSAVKLGSELRAYALVQAPPPIAMTAIVHAGALMILQMDERAGRNDAETLFIKQLREQVALMRFVQGAH